MLHYLKGLLTPLLYLLQQVIKFLFGVSKRVLAMAYKIQKNPRKLKCIACSAPLPSLWQFAKRAQIPFGAVANGNLLPFGLLCVRNPQIAHNAAYVLPYR
jgi:hypothetical protein